jgi:hypothetical protein
VQRKHCRAAQDNNRTQLTKISADKRHLQLSGDLPISWGCRGGRGKRRNAAPGAVHFLGWGSAMRYLMRMLNATPEKLNLAYGSTCQNCDCRDRQSRQFHIGLDWVHVFRLCRGFPLVSQEEHNATLVSEVEDATSSLTTRMAYLEVTATSVRLSYHLVSSEPSQVELTID